jgi:hypothetical protein
MARTKSRPERILKAIITREQKTDSVVVFNRNLAKRVFVKENKSLSPVRFHNNVMRAARRLRENGYLAGTNGQFTLTDKGFYRAN